MAAKPFEIIAALFREETGIVLSDKDLKYCQWVYQAHLDMLEDRKRTEPTRQNYGQYVDRMDCKLGHSTMWKWPNVAKFTDFLIDLRKTGINPAPKEPESEIEKQKETIKELRATNNGNLQLILRAESILKDYTKTCVNLELANGLINKMKEVFKTLGVDPNTIVYSGEIKKRYKVLPDGCWLDIVENKFYPPGRKPTDADNLEPDSDVDIDEQ